jgi:L-seryl-tRNA(Ser) seleniumtransferase
MAIKPPDLLNHLPSVSELLDKPPVRALVDRWNRSAVAGKLQSFLEELRSDFERRTAELPSIRELAERAARYVVSQQHQSLGTAINATGRMFGPPWVSTPISETALDRMVAFGRDYGTEPNAAASTSLSDLQAHLCRLTSSPAAAVVHSYASGLWLALAGLASNCETLVAAAEVGQIDQTDSLPKLARAAHTTLKQAGAVSGAIAADFRAVVSPQTSAILKSNSSFLPSVEAAAPTLEELVAIARDHKLILIDALGASPLVPPPANVSWSGRSAQTSLAAGTDLVILRGDAFVGGPACGILLGREELLRRIVEHPLFSLWQIDPLRSAGLSATIAAYDNPSANSLPAWQSLATSVENLRNRADRLAAQLTHATGVASAVAVETRSALSGDLADGWPSYGVALTATDGDLSLLEKRLSAARIPIFGRTEGEQILLDLRTVMPRQDKLIVDGLLDAKTVDPAG